ILYRALQQGDAAMLAAVARLAVARFAGMEPGRPVGGTYYLYRTLRNLDLDGLLARLIGEARAAAVGGEADDGAPGPTLRPGRPGRLTPLEERLLEEEYKARIEELRREVEAEIRRRLVADRGAEALARSLRKPLPEDVDFMHATRDELMAIRKAIVPLARKLQARLARKRRHLHRGALDFRSTMRHSLSYGGVPAEPRFRHPRPSKPEIFVVADISGSVAAFARFTLHLVHAIASQFSTVRSFVFIDGIDEVTAIFDRAETVAEAIHRVNQEADVVWVDGHSDYGHALNVFWQRWGRQVSPKTSLVVLGDARSNYHSPENWVMKELQQRARHVYWLNPEPRSYWGSG
ncbi:MAG: VWA domain-containing protein, partial [Acidimicrobiales bacterium]